ncbi:SusC/RagA family TonB-linked outer membrane protein [Danxiaibacter flavus]|uniref:SusC/RagA family TonB-linked outer membrane protein n=1 Tax=Danxiaibacter flavus TaxID=3049108 RepID=A0ABV3ZGG1_9BACT|nr:SusC/RagA family TonB-linked outer membrane protein [Chitinophagaceae bacterium DXS]
MRKTTIRISICVLLLSLTSLFVAAQDKITVAGTVKDSSSNPIPGVSIVIKGTSRGVSSDADGNFKIENVPKNATLVFSAVGHLPFEGKPSVVLNVVLQPDIKTAGDEVVVTAMGIKKEQKALGYAVSTVTAKDIQVATPNIASALYGKAVGVKVQSSPGGQTGAVSMTVRGVNSLNFNTQPLYILDGVPIRNGEANTKDMWSESRIQGNGLLDLNPDDIESLSILRGAAASALYGSEAINGVVVITTKSGKNRKKGLGVDFGVNQIIEKVGALPDFQNEFGPGYGFTGVNGLLTRGSDMDGFMKITGRDGLEYIRPSLSNWGNFGPKFDGRDVMWWDGIMRKYDAQPNNVKDIYGTGRNSNYNISISNSGALGSFRFSYNRNDYKSMMPGGKQVKNNFSFNGNLKASDRLSLNLVVNYINNITTNRPYLINNINAYGFSRAEKTDVMQQKFRTSQGYLYTSDKKINPDEYILYTPSTNYMNNILWTQLVNNDEEKINRMIASATINYKIASFLNIRGRIGNDFSSGFTETKNYNQQPSVFTNGGYYGVVDNRQRISYGDIMAIFTKKVNDFDLGATAGYLAKQEEYTTNATNTDGGLVQEGWFSLKNSINPLINSMTRQKKLKNGFFGIVNGSFRNMLFVEVSVRMEKASTLPPQNNNFTYPSASLSWLFTESFKNTLPSWLNYGKLRGSFGVVGNEPAIYAANNAYSQSTVNGVAINGIPSNYGNDQIRPEKKREVEFGLETKMFKNRFGVDITYYSNTIIDQIINLDVPSSSGAKTILSNLGKIGNSGIEVALNGTPVQSRKWRWDVRFNFAYNRNSIKELPKGVNYLKLADIDNNALMIVAEAGRPFGDIMTYSYKLDANGHRLVDDEGTYIKDDKPSVHGNTTPKGIGGFASSLLWNTKAGTFSLDAMFDYRIGGDMFSLANYQNTAAGKLKSTLKYRDASRGGLKYYVSAKGDRVAYDGAMVPADAKYNGKIFEDGIITPGYTNDGKPNSLIISAAEYYMNNNYWYYGIYDNAIYDNSYLKFRELTINYSIPQVFLKKTGMQSVMLSLIGRNLFYIFKNLPNSDPESAVGTTAKEMGLDRYGIPSTRSYGIALKVGL